MERDLALSNVYSMVSLGLTNTSFAEYEAMYANPFSPQYSNITSALAYPLGVTNLNDWTYVAFALSYYQYSPQATHAVRIIRAHLREQDNDWLRALSYYGVAGYPAAVLDLYVSLGKKLGDWLSILFLAVFAILLLMTDSLLHSPWAPPSASSSSSSPPRTPPTKPRWASGPRDTWTAATSSSSSPSHSGCRWITRSSCSAVCWRSSRRSATWMWR